MSWPVGYCEKCGSCEDFKYSWGYEKEYGLEFVDGKILCQKCKRIVDKKKRK